MGRGHETIPKDPRSLDKCRKRLMAIAKLRRARLKGDGQAVELEVDEVAGGIASLAAGGDVGAALLLDGNGDCEES